MKTRHHQYLDQFILGMIAIASIQSIFLGNNILDSLSLVSMYVVLASIVDGFAVVAYILVSKHELFDPLNSDLEEDDDFDTYDDD